VLFRGIHERVELDLCGKDKAHAGAVVPTFYSLAGEPTAIPEKFLGVLRAATKGVNCIGCSHAHFLRKPRPRRVGDCSGNESTHQGASSTETAAAAQALEG
jgi:hypothetical protein